MDLFDTNSNLVVQFLGESRLRNAASIQPVPLTPRLRDLLAILVSNNGAPFQREQLLDRMWPDSDEADARRSLRTALWRLRRLVEPAGVQPGTYLSCDDPDAIRFRTDSDAVVDARMFEISIRDCSAEEASGCTEAIERALSLYGGDYLPGSYSDWAILERERLRDRYATAQSALAKHYAASGAHERALQAFHTVLSIDPLREPVHRHVMRLCLRMGWRSRAIKHYRELTAQLNRELGVDPAPETRAVYEEALRLGTEPAETAPLAAANIRHGGDRPANAPEPDSVRCALDEIRGVIRQARKVEAHLSLRLSQND